MRAVVLQPGQRIGVADVPGAKLVQPTDVLVQVSLAAICGSDVHIKRGGGCWASDVHEPFRRTCFDARHRRVGAEAQAVAWGLPLMKVLLPDPCTDEEHRDAMAKAITEVRGEGVRVIA
jgi:hypothetical protein